LFNTFAYREKLYVIDIELLVRNWQKWAMICSCAIAIILPNVYLRQYEPEIMFEFHGKLGVNSFSKSK